MANTTVVVGKDRTQERRTPRPEAVRAGIGSVVGWVGLAFLLVGGFDFAFTWYPPGFGSREWEFGSVTQSFNGLPVPTMGMALLLAGALLLERRWWAWIVGLVASVLTVWVLVGIVLWSTTIPLALQGTPIDALTGTKRAMVRTAVQSVVYPFLFGFLSWRAIGTIRGTIGARGKS